jgi:hypothetical protein
MLKEVQVEHEKKIKKIDDTRELILARVKLLEDKDADYSAKIANVRSKQNTQTLILERFINDYDAK